MLISGTTTRRQLVSERPITALLPGSSQARLRLAACHGVPRRGDCYRYEPTPFPSTSTTSFRSLTRMERRTRDDDFETSLNSLSTEVVVLIAEHLVGGVQALFESKQGHVYPSSRLPNLPNEHTLSVTGLLSLALASRRYQSIAQEVLYRAPMPRNSALWNENTPVFLLTRTLLSSPHLARHVNTLRLDIPGCLFDQIPPSVTTDALVTQTQTFIDGVNWMDSNFKEGWKYQLAKLRQLPFLALILSLSPRLKSLCLTKRDGSYAENSLLSEMFWSTLVGTMSEEDHHQAMEQLGSCPGLAGLQHLRTTSMTQMSMPPFSDLRSLMSLDLALNDWPDDVTVPVLARIKKLRLDCWLAWRPEVPRGPYILYELISVLLKSFPKLEELVLYDGSPYTKNTLHIAEHGQRRAVHHRQYDALVNHLHAVNSTLKRLELPGGWWCSRPAVKATSQPGANTGTIAKTSDFSELQTLVMHSTAILKKGIEDTEVADPVTTLPSSIKEITVYGAHDGLWSWVIGILDREGSQFPCLRSIELRREEPVHPELRLSTLEELKATQEKLWEKLKNSKVCVSIDGNKRACDQFA
jgi:hypothetical protein